MRNVVQITTVLMEVVDSVVPRVLVRSLDLLVRQNQKKSIVFLVAAALP